MPGAPQPPAWGTFPSSVSSFPPVCAGSWRPRPASSLRTTPRSAAPRAPAPPAGARPPGAAPPQAPGSAYRLPRRKPSRRRPPASPSAPAHSQRERRPAPAAASASCSGFHISDCAPPRARPARTSVSALGVRPAFSRPIRAGGGNLCGGRPPRPLGAALEGAASGKVSGPLQKWGRRGLPRAAGDGTPSWLCLRGSEAGLVPAISPGLFSSGGP